MSAGRWWGRVRDRRSLRVGGVRGRRHVCSQLRFFPGKTELPPESWQISWERWDLKPPQEWELALGNGCWRSPSPPPPPLCPFFSDLALMLSCLTGRE